MEQHGGKHTLHASDGITACACGSRAGRERSDRAERVGSTRRLGAIVRASFQNEEFLKTSGKNARQVMRQSAIRPLKPPLP